MPSYPITSDLILPNHALLRVADVTELKAVTNMTTGAMVYVVANGGVYRFDGASSATADDTTIVAPDAGGIGRWIEKMGPSTSAALSAADATTNANAIGTIVSRATAPTNGTWLECNGSVVSRATYPALYAAIGQLSPVPKTWSSATLPVTIATNACAALYANSLFVIVSGANIITSSDGVTWTTRVTTGTNLAGVTYANGLWVAWSSTNTTLFTSSNGTSWTARTGPTGGCSKIAYGNGKWVAASFTGSSSVCIWYSSDAITWTQATSVIAGLRYDVIYANGIWVCVGGSSAPNATIATSTDGVTWTNRTAPTGERIYSIGYGAGQFIAAIDVSSTSNFSIGYSPDGISWGTVASFSNPDQAQLTSVSYAVVYQNDLFILTVEYSLLTSIDGLHWRSQRLQSAGDSANLAYESGLWILGGGQSGSCLLLTHDMSTFSLAPSLLASHGQLSTSVVAYGANRWIAIPRGGTNLAYSEACNPATQFRLPTLPKAGGTLTQWIKAA